MSSMFGYHANIVIEGALNEWSIPQRSNRYTGIEAWSASLVIALTNLIDTNKKSENKRRYMYVFHYLFVQKGNLWSIKMLYLYNILYKAIQSEQSRKFKTRFPKLLKSTNTLSKNFTLYGYYFFFSE